MRLRTLSEWLTWIKTLHPVEMDLSLERVTEIAKRLHLLNPAYTVVTVAGTNGKGSCVAGLEAIYLAAGYQVGAFTSPYLFQYNEQVRIQGIAVDDDAFCRAFEKVADACQEITLTPFEFTALAAFVIFPSRVSFILFFFSSLRKRRERTPEPAKGSAILRFCLERELSKRMEILRLEAITGL